MLQVISTDLLLAGTQSQQDPPTAEPPGKTTSRGSSDVTRCHLWLPTPPPPPVPLGSHSPGCRVALRALSVPASCFPELFLLLGRTEPQQSPWKAQVFLNIQGRAGCVTPRWGNQLLSQAG